MEYGLGQGFANLLNAHMRSRGLTIGKLAELTGKSYEHCRKLVGGEALPSPLLVEKLAAVTGLPVAPAQQAAERDRMLRHYGQDMVAEVAGNSSRVESFAPLLNALTDEQAECARAMLQGLLNSGHLRPLGPNVKRKTPKKRR
jgi:hypothetical protein